MRSKAHLIEKVENLPSKGLALGEGSAYACDMATSVPTPESHPQWHWIVGDRCSCGVTFVGSYPMRSYQDHLVKVSGRGRRISSPAIKSLAPEPILERTWIPLPSRPDLCMHNGLSAVPTPPRSTAE